MLRVERQCALRHQQGEQPHQPYAIKQQNGEQILAPVHLLGTNPREPPNAALNAGKHRQRGIVDHSGQQRPRRASQHHQQQKKTGDK